MLKMCGSASLVPYSKPKICGDEPIRSRQALHHGASERRYPLSRRLDPAAQGRVSMQI